MRALLKASPNQSQSQSQSFPHPPYGHLPPQAGEGKAKSQKPKTKSQKPKSQKAKSEERRATSHEPRAKSQKPKAKSQEPRAKSQKPKAKSQEPRAKSQKPRVKSQKPKARAIPACAGMTAQQQQQEQWQQQRIDGQCFGCNKLQQIPSGLRKKRSHLTTQKARCKSSGPSIRFPSERVRTCSSHRPGRCDPIPRFPAACPWCRHRFRTWSWSGCWPAGTGSGP